MRASPSNRSGLDPAAAGQDSGYSIWIDFTPGDYREVEE
jgi:hypothetical protein